MILKKQDKKFLINTIKDLPPLEYLNYCDTLPQISYWLALGEDYNFLKIAFIAYFKGNSNEFLKKIPEDKRKFFILMRDWYLAFYTMIQGNWEEIVIITKEKNYLIEKIPVTTPGEGLIRTIENDCAVFFSVCIQPYYKYSVDESRNMAKLDRELAMMEGLGKIKTEEDLKKLKIYNNYLKRQLNPFYKFLAFREICIQICSEAKKSSITHIHYTDYKRKQAALDQCIQGSIHRRFKVKGHTWIKGECTSH
jgi:hypothetical protein